MPSLSIQDSLAGPLSARLNQAAEDNDYLLAGVVNELLPDQTIDTEELTHALRENFHLSSGSAERRAEAFIERMRQIAGANGNESIDSTEEADQIYNLLTSEEAFLLAGGVVVYNDLSDRDQLSIRLNCPGLTDDALRERVISHEAWRYLHQMAMSFSSPVPGQASQYYLFNYLKVTALNRVIPAVTLLNLSGSGDIFRADWSLVTAPQEDYANLVRGHRDEIEVALTAAGEDHEPEDVDTVVGDFIDLRDRVSASWGSHLLDTTTGDYVHIQGSDVSMDSIASDDQVISAAAETALYMCGDHRHRDRPEIPAWIHEDRSYDSTSPARPSDADRAETVEPAD